MGDPRLKLTILETIQECMANLCTKYCSMSRGTEKVRVAQLREHVRRITQKVDQWRGNIGKKPRKCHSKVTKHGGRQSKQCCLVEVEGAWRESTASCFKRIFGCQHPLHRCHYQALYMVG